MDGLNTIVSFWDDMFSGAIAVSFWEGSVMCSDVTTSTESAIFQQDWTSSGWTNLMLEVVKTLQQWVNYGKWSIHFLRREPY